MQMRIQMRWQTTTMQLPPINLCSPSMMRSMPFRPCGCSSALILLMLAFDPPRTNDGILGSAFVGGMKERIMSNVLSMPATTMPTIVLSTVRIYQIRGRGGTVGDGAKRTREDAAILPDDDFWTGEEQTAFSIVVFPSTAALGENDGWLAENKYMYCLHVESISKKKITVDLNLNMMRILKVCQHLV